MIVRSANPGTAASATSAAVWARSRLLPIRAAASLSQLGAGCGQARWTITTAPPPSPPSGSQRIANRPSPSRPPATVAVHTRPAATSPSARLTSSRWPGPVISTSHTSCPATAAAGCPNNRVAVTDQEVTLPWGSRVKVARPARSGSRRRGSPGPPSLGICDSIGTCTSLDDEPAGRRLSGHYGRGPSSRGGSVRAARPVPLRCRANTKCIASSPPSAGDDSLVRRDSAGSRPQASEPGPVYDYGLGGRHHVLAGQATA